MRSKRIDLKIFGIRLLFTILGTMIASIGINGLLIPNNILSGGVTGIAVVLNVFFGLDISLMIVLINIPIFIIGYRFINREYIIHSILGMISLSFFLTVTKNCVIESNELLTTVLLGGVLTGVGYGLIFRVNSSTGGNDIISKVLNKKYSYSVATFNFIFNLLIIGLSIYSFGVDLAVVTLATMYISSVTSKFILEGTNYKRTVLIITNVPNEVANEVNIYMHRGCTILEGIGSYTGKERFILYAIISVNQVAKLKAIVKDVDSHALINVIESRVVFGNGFVNIEADH